MVSITHILHGKKQIAIIAALFCAISAASLFLLPGKQEVALMQMKDKRFEEATKTYESQLAQNKLTLEVASNLSELYLKMGNVEKAIAIMQAFVDKNPKQIEARKRLGTFFMYANQQENYLKNLEEINTLGSDSETLKQLSYLYNANGEYDKQAKALRALIKQDQGKTPSYFVDLANVLALGHNYKDAMSVLREFQTLYPEHYTFNEAQMFVTFLLEDNNTKDALIEAKGWVYAYKNFDEAAQLAGTLHYKGSPELALEFMAKFKDDEINSNEALLEQYVLAKTAIGEKADIYRRLKLLAEKGKLPPKLTKSYIYAAMSDGDMQMVRSLLLSIDLTNYSEAELLGLVEQAQQRNNPAYITMLKERFPETEYRSSHPLLVVAIDIVSHKGDFSGRFDYLDRTALTNAQALQIAMLCNNVKKPLCTEHFLDKIHNSKGFDTQQVVSVGQLYADINQLQKGQLFLASAAQENPAPEIEKMLAIYAAALGEDETLKSWFAAHQDITDQTTLNDLLFIANKHQRVSTAVLIAEVMQQRYNTTTSRLLLADAYLKAGQEEKAVTLLRNNLLGSPDDMQNYLSILTALAAKNQTYHAELRMYVVKKLEVTKDEKERIALVYTLLNIKEIEAALPYIAELAEDKGGEWASLYAASLDKAGKHEEARKFWLKVASHPSATADEKRTIAFSLLNAGYKSDAEQIFAQLAANAAPDSNDVKTLLYLWGPELSEAQVNWLTSRALSTRSAAWLDLIANYASDEAVLNFLEKWPQAMSNVKISARYIQANLHNGSFARKAPAEIEAASAAKNQDLLRQYGEVSSQEGLKELARKSYQYILAIEEDDSDALRALAMMAFEDGRYADSESYLRHYFAALDAKKKTDPERFRVNFTYAEIQRYYDKKEAAKPYYANALELIEEDKLTAADAMTIKALSLIGLGRNKEAIAVFADAMKRYPDNAMLRADYANALMDIERYEDATSVLAGKEPSSGAMVPMQIPTHLPHNRAQSHRLLENGTKLLVEFTQKLEEKDLETLRAMRDVPWVNYVSEGYGEIIVVAKPGYRMNVQDNKALLLVSAAWDEDSRAYKMAQEVPLRYELLEARKEMDTGDTYHADMHMKNLLAEHADNMQVLSLSASAANSAGNWPRAQELAKKARALMPEHEGMQKLLRELYKQNAPNVTADYENLSNGQNSQNIATLTGLNRYSDDLYIGGMVKNIGVDVQALRRADGRIGNFKENKQQFEFNIQKFADNNDRYKAALFSNSNTFGLGGYYSFLNPYGTTTLSAEWQKPYWEGFDAILDETTRNRLAVSHNFKPSRRWYIGATGALNQYDNSVEDDVLESLYTKFEAIYTLIDAHPYVALGYGFDGEYDLHHKMGPDSLGNYSRLFAQGSREVHFFSVNVAEQFNDKLSGDIFAGYAYDRFGSSSPSFSGKLSYAVSDNVDIQLRGLYGLDRSSSSSATTRIGVNLRWRLGDDANK